MTEVLTPPEAQADEEPFEAWESIDNTLDGLERHFRVTNALFLEKMGKFGKKCGCLGPFPAKYPKNYYSATLWNRSFNLVVKREAGVNPHKKVEVQ
jgi:hypothetical protein